MIIEERAKDSKKFDELKPGDVFRDHGTIWVRCHALNDTNPCVAINPATGQWSFAWKDDELVEHLPHAKLVVTR